ncbi:hypothetical protein BH18ACT17_BH18ACT17_07490 [soil metagenome]
MTSARIEVEGWAPSGLAEMLAGLLEQNLAREPRRAAHLKPSMVVLVVPDAGVAVTVRVARGEVRIADGAAAEADLRVIADADRLLALAVAPLRAGLPDPLHPAGRAAFADVASGRVRVHVLFRHPLRFARFTSLLSVYEPARGRSSR